MNAASPNPAELSHETAVTVLQLRYGPTLFEVDRSPALIGRIAPAQVVLAPTQVSRRHALLQCDADGHWRISDQHSSSGTVLNGQRLDALAWHSLQPGDRLHIADQVLDVVSVRCPVPNPAPSTPDDPLFQNVAGHEAGASLGRMHTYRVRPVLALGATDAVQALELVLDLSRALARAVSLDPVLTAVATAVTRLIGSAERIALLRLRDGQLLYAVRDRHVCSTERPPWLSQTVVNWVLSSGNVLISNNPLDDVRFDGAQSLVLGRARGLLVAPISDGEQVVGVLYVDTLASVTYPTASQRLADIISTIAEASQGALERLLQTSAHRDELSMRQNLQRFLAPQVVARLRSEGSGGRRLVARRVEASVLFADIAGFTDLSARLAPEEIADVLNIVFGVLVPVVFAHEGTLDKFIGDCLMAVFGAPDELPDHADRAVSTGLKLISTFDDCVARLTLPTPVRLRVAVHSGPLVAGEMGSELRREYTVIGTTVNIAARIEGIGEAGALTVSEETRSRLKQPWLSAETGVFPLKGIPQPVRLFRMARVP
jgi:adenylate cyclase